jgi:hypothetical protein
VGKYGTLGSAFDRIFRNTLNKALDDVDTDINAQKTRVDDLIVGTPQPSEVIDARGGFPVLSGRLDDLSSSLAQIATNAKPVFGAKGDNSSNDTVPLTNALKSNYTTIFLPDGVFKITDTMLIDSGSNKKVIGSKNTVISIQLTTSKTILDMSINIAFENITFDFNNSYVTNGLLFREDLGKISLKNCSFKNVKDTNKTTSTTVVFIANKGNELDIDGLTFTNLLKRQNGVITDGGGSLTGLLVSDLVTPSIINGGTIRNVRFEECHNINDSDVISYEDISCIYLTSTLPTTQRISNILMENISGYNFGKRLIKTQVGSLTINNVYGKSDIGDTLSVIGVMDSQNVLMSNIRCYGKMSAAIATSCKNTIINNIDIDIQKSIVEGNTAFGVQIGADNVTVTNFQITAERNIVLFNPSQIMKNITIDNGAFILPTFGFVGIQFLTDSYGFDGLKISNVSLENKSTFTGSINAFLDTLNFSIGTKTGNNLQINNINIVSSHPTENIEYMFYLHGISNSYIKDVTYSKPNNIRQYRGFYFEQCSSIDIANVNILAYVQAACQIKDCQDMSVTNLKTNPTTDYLMTVANSTKIKLKDVNKTKVLLTDATSIQNTSFNQDFGTGTTVNRPNSPTMGFQYYDIDLDKPIWWNGVSWKDGIGTTV